MKRVLLCDALEITIIYSISTRGSLTIYSVKKYSSDKELFNPIDYFPAKNGRHYSVVMVGNKWLLLDPLIIKHVRDIYPRVNKQFIYSGI